MKYTWSRTSTKWRHVPANSLQVLRVDEKRSHLPQLISGFVRYFCVLLHYARNIIRYCTKMGWLMNWGHDQSLYFARYELPFLPHSRWTSYARSAFSPTFFKLTVSSYLGLSTRAMLYVCVGRDNTWRPGQFYISRRTCSPFLRFVTD